MPAANSAFATDMVSFSEDRLVVVGNLRSN